MAHREAQTRARQTWRTWKAAGLILLAYLIIAAVLT